MFALASQTAPEECCAFMLCDYIMYLEYFKGWIWYAGPVRTLWGPRYFTIILICCIILTNSVSPICLSLFTSTSYQYSCARGTMIFMAVGEDYQKRIFILTSLRPPASMNLSCPFIFLYHFVSSNGPNCFFPSHLESAHFVISAPWWMTVTISFPVVCVNLS